MSKRIYSLRISCSSIEQKKVVSELLNISSNKNLGNIWCLEVEENMHDDYFDFINYFLSILDTKYGQLEIINVSRSDISLWYLYEYDNQCNIEFLPNDLKKLGDNGISLCISCWDSCSNVIEIVV